MNSQDALWEGQEAKKFADFTQNNKTVFGSIGPAMVQRPAGPRSRRLQLAQRDLFHQMIVALAQDQVGTGARGKDVLAQVAPIDVPP